MPNVRSVSVDFHKKVGEEILKVYPSTTSFQVWMDEDRKRVLGDILVDNNENVSFTVPVKGVTPSADTEEDTLLATTGYVKALMNSDSNNDESYLIITLASRTDIQGLDNYIYPQISYDDLVAAVNANKDIKLITEVDGNNHVFKLNDYFIGENKIRYFNFVSESGDGVSSYQYELKYYGTNETFPDGQWGCDLKTTPEGAEEALGLDRYKSIIFLEGLRTESDGVVNVELFSDISLVNDYDDLFNKTVMLQLYTNENYDAVSYYMLSGINTAITAEEAYVNRSIKFSNDKEDIVIDIADNLETTITIVAKDVSSSSSEDPNAILYTYIDLSESEDSGCNFNESLLGFEMPNIDNFHYSEFELEAQHGKLLAVNLMGMTLVFYYAGSTNDACIFNQHSMDYTVSIACCVSSDGIIEFGNGRAYDSYLNEDEDEDEDPIVNYSNVFIDIEYNSRNSTTVGGKSGYTFTLKDPYTSESLSKDEMNSGRLIRLQNIRFSGMPPVLYSSDIENSSFDENDNVIYWRLRSMGKMDDILIYPNLGILTTASRISNTSVATVDEMLQYLNIIVPDFTEEEF